jgi:NAD(P)-dependent dehydrogenase (short-subunit alcohol dehydrogenase family)
VSPAADAGHRGLPRHPRRLREPLGGGPAAVAFLASAEARYVTGVALPVDAGMLVR